MGGGRRAAIIPNDSRVTFESQGVADCASVPLAGARGIDMRRWLLTCLFLIVAAPALAQTQGLELFPTEQLAQQHCPGDVVVWLNTPTGIYHYKGERWYGTTRNGAFVCKQEADNAGDRASHNGQ